MTENPEAEQERLRLDRERFEHDKQLDQKKLNQERRRIRLTAGSIIVSLALPLLIAAVTFASASYSQRQGAQAQFELQAAEIVMNSEGPSGTYNRALVLRKLFPHRLPDDFAARFDPNDPAFKNTIGTVEAKKELLTLIAEHPNERRQIIDTWKQLFPEAEWVRELE